MSKSTKESVVYLLVVLATLAFVSFILFQRETEISAFTGSHEVTLSINPEYVLQAQVLLDVDGVTEVFGIIDDVYTRHYHPAEFVDGSLYVIRRIGDVETENWMDQLWRYETEDRGEMLYEWQGLDFRVSPNGEVISMRVGTLPFKLLFLHPNGEIIQELHAEDLDMTEDLGFKYLQITNEHLLFSTTLGPAISHVVDYQYLLNSFSKWDISKLGIEVNEYDWNLERQLIVYSDYIFAFDHETEEELTVIPVSLYLYDLETESKRLLVTSPYRHEFDPKWISETEIEFNALDGRGREQISVE